MFGNLKNIYKMQKQAKQLKKEMESKSIIAQSNDKKVKIEANGLPVVHNVEVDDSLFTKDKKHALEESIKEACNDLQEKLKSELMGSMGDIQDMLG